MSTVREALTGSPTPTSPVVTPTASGSSPSAQPIPGTVHKPPPSPSRPPDPPADVILYNGARIATVATTAAVVIGVLATALISWLRRRGGVRY